MQIFLIIIHFHLNFMDIIMVEIKFGTHLEECKNIEFVDQKNLPVQTQSVKKIYWLVYWITILLIIKN